MKKIILNILLIISGLSLFAQQLPLNKQYLHNTAVLIPAATGFSGNWETFLTLRQNWIGINGSPKSAILNINGQLPSNLGLGLTFSTTKTGNYTQTFLRPAIAYHIHFNEDMRLSAAIMPEYYSNQLNLGNVHSFGTQIDPVLQNTNRLSVSSFDVGVSLLFSAYNFNIGVSVPQTLAMTVKLDDEGHNFSMQRHYFGYASYLLDANDWEIKPSVVVRMTETSPVNYEGVVQVRYKKHISAGLGYSSDQSLLFSVGALSGSNLWISYSYEIGFAGLSAASLGSHELTIGFLIKPAQKFNYVATVFIPQENVIAETDENIVSKVQSLENQLKNEQQRRLAKDDDLQWQIDSLKGLIGTGTAGNQTQGLHWRQRIVSQNVNFSLLDNNILPSSYSELDKYAEKLKADKSLKVKILVYTDNLYSDEISKKMAEERAKAVADYFKSKGVSENQIIYEGMGAVDPIADNTTTQGREENNRVEFLFSKRIF